MSRNLALTNTKICDNNEFTGMKIYGHIGKYLLNI